jgi:diguanylate cyclase (GGDEF)-like protein
MKSIIDKQSSLSPQALRLVQEFEPEPDSRFPVLRGTVLEILRLAGDPECPHEDLVGLVASDPSLSLKVLKYANSAAFHLRTEATSVTRAVSLIGTRALRNLAVCFAACEGASQDDLGELDLSTFLKDSLRRGAAAELLAKAMSHSDTDEAFTAGLLQDYGVLALAMREPSRAGDWFAIRQEPASHRRELERAIFGETHDEIAKELASKWHLPEAIADVMCLHHRPETSPAPGHANLVQLAAWAEVVADVYIRSDKEAAIEEAYEQLANECDLTREEITSVVEEVPSCVERYASILGLHIERHPTFQDVIDQRREQTRLLIEMNLSYQQETSKLQSLLDEKEKVERELLLAKTRLERLAMTDALTNLPNRRNFETNLEREVERAREPGRPLSVLIVDLDLFKSVNDTYGHPFGDLVLRMVGDALQANVRNTDLVARVGGEEFAVLLPATGKSEAAEVAERLRKVVGSLEPRCGNRTVGITISVGGATAAQVQSETLSAKAGWDLYSEADKALYSAKGNGRDCCAWADQNGNKGCESGVPAKTTSSVTTTQPFGCYDLGFEPHQAHIR